MLAQNRLNSYLSPSAMKLLKIMLRAADYVALVICMIAFCVLIGAALFHALHELIWGTWHELTDMWSHRSDRIVIGVVLGCGIWCGFRWKQLNNP